MVGVLVGVLVGIKVVFKVHFVFATHLATVHPLTEQVLNWSILSEEQVKSLHVEINLQSFPPQVLSAQTVQVEQFNVGVGVNVASLDRSCGPCLVS